MTYDLFWNASPFIAKAYRKKHYIETEEANAQAWLQGMYVYNAVGTVISNAFGKHSNAKYMEKPIEILPKTPKQIENEAKEARQHAIDAFNAMLANFTSTQGSE